MRRTRTAALIAALTAVLSAGAAAADENEERREETPPPTPAPAPTPTPPPSPPASEPTPSLGASIAEPPPTPKKNDEPVDEPWVTGTARLADRFYEGGPFMGAGGPLAVNGLVSDVNISGVRVLENHGYLSKILVGTLVAMGQGNSRYVGSTYHTDYRGNVWRTDYYRPLTAAEREENARQLRAAISAEYVMELTVYSPSLWLGKRDDEKAYAKGFEYYLGGEFPLGGGGDDGLKLPTILQVAFVASHVTTDALFKPGEGPHKDANQAAVHRERLRYTNLGVMLRAIIPITRWAEAYVHWDINALTFFAKADTRDKGYVWTSPLRAGLNFNLTDRAYLRAHGSVNGLGSYGLGWHSEIGVRF